MAQQGFSRSSQAYDQCLLSRIDKLSCPPYHWSHSSKAALASAGLSFKAKHAMADHRSNLSDSVSAPAYSPGSLASTLPNEMSSHTFRIAHKHKPNSRRPFGVETSYGRVRNLQSPLHATSRRKIDEEISSSVNEDSSSNETGSLWVNYDQARLTPDETEFGNDDPGLLYHRWQQDSRSDLKPCDLSSPTTSIKRRKSPAIAGNPVKAARQATPRSTATSYHKFSNHESVFIIAPNSRWPSHTSSLARSTTGSRVSSNSSHVRPSHQ